MVMAKGNEEPPRVLDPTFIRVSISTNGVHERTGTWGELAVDIQNEIAAQYAAGHSINEVARGPYTILWDMRHVDYPPQE